MRTLNLAKQPFRNDRLPTLTLALLLVLLAAFSVGHALAAFALRPGGAGDAARELTAIRQQIATLRAESRDLSGASARPETIEEWAAIKDLVDRRAFSWTGLFAALEQALPPGVRLESVSPASAQGPIVIRLEAVGRSVEDALALPTALQAQGEFEDPFLAGYSESDRGVAIHCSVRYVGPGIRRAAGGRP
jgi:Tfp pilus assembly protein PilN